MKIEECKKIALFEAHNKFYDGIIYGASQSFNIYDM